MWNQPSSGFPKHVDGSSVRAHGLQRAVVTWRLAGDSAEVEHAVWLTFLEVGGEVKVAGTIDEPPRHRP